MAYLSIEELQAINRELDRGRAECQGYAQLIKIVRHCPSCRELFKKYLQNKANEVEEQT